VKPGALSRHQLTHEDIADLAAGCSFLGSGGGGDPHAFVVALENVLEDGRGIPLVDPADLSPSALVINVGFVGSPFVLKEKLFTAEQMTRALEEMSNQLGRPIDAVMASEIGGANGVVPFLAAALANVPVVDADGMGRAFPMSHQVSYSIHGRPSCPTIAVSASGDVVRISSASNRRAEDLARAVSVVMGHCCFVADYPLSGQEVRDYAILGSASLASRLGRALRSFNGDFDTVLASLRSAIGSGDGRACEGIFHGKVISSEQQTRAGFSFGTVVLENAANAEETMVLEFQNEFLVARSGDSVVATTPDIITVLDADSMEAIGSDAIRYGQRVRVVCLESDPRMCSPEALAIVGPGAFTYEMDYQPIGRHTPVDES